jgi:hypothetical protein
MLLEKYWPFESAARKSRYCWGWEIKVAVDVAAAKHEVERALGSAVCG